MESLREGFLAAVHTQPPRRHCGVTASIMRVGCTRLRSQEPGPSAKMDDDRVTSALRG